MTAHAQPRELRTDNRVSGRRPLARAAASRRNRNIALLFLTPFALLFLAVYIIPIAYTVDQSLYKLRHDGLGLGAPTKVFNALGNYADVLRDSAFTGSIERVLLIGLVQVPIMLGLALLLALLLDARSTVLKRFFRLAYFLPYALPGVVGSLMWAYLVDPGLSPITALAHDIGWNLNPTSSRMLAPTIGNMLTWGWTGYNMLIIYSALQAIPPELSEAARMDGCSAWRISWHVKIPMVRPALILTTVFSIIGTAQLYNEPATLQTVAPNVGSSYTPIFAAFTAVADNDFPYAATESVILALLTLIVSFGFLRLVQRTGSIR
ncbi:sugar ABC transporter permease [Actinospica sp. MGRD01-02]|uniref:Sugar ABC transporter permease n=1 Tax=Actinospica acidithermotolerans TaxID=2828514 RepID=A0A941E735_9ACTN|nr:sugar ABC transporter permease [Actinospica acidithermotolerans]MBR7825143.1 sugar ABC transporter permease [Actinospica acidithermotolerans]